MDEKNPNSAALLFILDTSNSDLIFPVWAGTVWNGYYSRQEVL